MTDANPLQFCDRLRETLVRYLATTVGVSDDYPGLARRIRNELEHGATLVKGPYLETLPDFEKGRSIADLCGAGILHGDWSALRAGGHGAHLWTRQLHSHQDRALSLAQAGENYLVATGTGSGKTESFLYPLIDRILRDPERDRPGVRAVIIYPLNALANDQLYFRLAPLLLRDLGDPGITFGRFTSAVGAAADRSEVEDELRGNELLMEALGSPAAIPASWLLSRREMLDRPPHILITNYAMLEHLLLLPRNAPLFAGARLQTLVLDEVHTYAGAQAIEVAFLLRKLKNHLGLKAGKLNCVGTSASLASGDRAESRVLEFASDLFGEQFGHVVGGSRLQHPALTEPGAEWSLPADAWARLGVALRDEANPADLDSRTWNAMCEAAGAPSARVEAAAGPLGAALVPCFGLNREVRALARALASGVRRFQEVASEVFGARPEAADALAGVVAVGLLCRADPSEFPLLPARYHVAATGIEGACVRLDGDVPEGWSDLALKRSAEGPNGEPYYPLLRCVSCARPFVETWREDGHLQPRPTSLRSAIREVLWLGRLPVTVTVARNGNFDQAAFAAFDRYLGEVPAVARVALDNADFFRRHQESTLLAGFLRHRVRDLERNSPRLRDLVGEQFDTQAAVDDFCANLSSWLESEPGRQQLALATRLADYLPDALAHVGRRDDYLASGFRETMRTFAVVHAERLAGFRERMAAAVEAEKHAAAAAQQAQQRRYLDQRLVDLFSRQAIIPTYSFPVHNVRLEVIREAKGRAQPWEGGDGGVELSRDAALGISEYAPGAEVVAAGRIWVSAGIARYPKEFMPDQYYRSCDACHHVQIADDRGELLQSCPNCGAAYAAPPRTCVQPISFVTSLADRNGRDPGVSRLRSRPADEARLITIPRLDRFAEDDVPGVRFVTLRGSPLPNEAEAEGRLVVINRGPKSFGFLRCPWCEHAEPAKAAFGAQKLSTHRDPRTGETCGAGGGKGVWPADLAHVFETDVVQLRFSRPFPELANAAPAAGRESFLRTLSEALRLAASRLLGVDRRDLRSTYVVAPEGPVVALYDGIPGGAGYSRRVGSEEAPIRRLLEETAELLECRAGQCASSCRACLNDYGNQLWWDVFDRKPVLEWLRDLLAEHTARAPGADHGAVRWGNPSLTDLDARLAGRPEVFVCAPTLSGPEPNAEVARATLVFLRGLAERGTRVNIVTTSSATEGVAGLPPAERALFHYLGEFAAPAVQRVRWLRAPDGMPPPARVFTPPGPHALAVLTDLPSGPLLDGLLPGTLALLSASAGDPLHLQNFIGALVCQDPPAAQAYAGVRRWHLRAGERRELREIFGGLAGAKARAVTIRDPYSIANEENRRHLGAFLASLSGILADLGQVAVVFRFDPRGGESESQQQQAAKRLLVGILGGDRVRFIPHQRRYAQDDFHDRVIDIIVAEPPALAGEHSFELSGGVDRLMGERFETRVFYVRGRSSGAARPTQQAAAPRSAHQKR